jgi:hypothetical protein
MAKHMVGPASAKLRRGPETHPPDSYPNPGPTNREKAMRHLSHCIKTADWLGPEVPHELRYLVKRIQRQFELVRDSLGSWPSTDHVDLSNARKLIREVISNTDKLERRVPSGLRDVAESLANQTGRVRYRVKAEDEK